MSDSTSALNQGNCSVCYCEFEGSPISLKCGHEYCSYCWLEYLKEKVKAGPESIFATCQQSNCTLKVSHSVWIDVLGGDDDDLHKAGLKKYLQWHCKHFTDHNKCLVSCSSKECSLYLEQTCTFSSPILTCSCLHATCLKCGNEDHTPARCIDVKNWREKEQSDSENIKWI